MGIVRDDIALETLLQSRSFWTLIAIALLVAALVAATFGSLSMAGADAAVIMEMGQESGSDVIAWLLSDPEAEMWLGDLMSLQASNGPVFYLMVLGALSPLVAAVWGASVTASEFSARTARVRAAHQGWSRTVFAKQLIIGAFVVAGTAAVAAFGVLGGQARWALFAQAHPDLAALSSSLPQQSMQPVAILAAAGAVALGTLFYALLASAIALTARSTAVGIIGGVAFPYLEQYAAQWWLPRSAYGSLLRDIMPYYQGSFAAEPFVSNPPPTSAAAVLVMVVWLAAVIVVSQLIARRQQIK